MKRMDLFTELELMKFAEFQIPQQVARYASFMFSFLGRGICTSYFRKPPNNC